MILSKIQEDPQSASCLNISYGDVQGLVANPNPTGSPFATVAQSSERSVKGAVVLPNTPFSLNLGNGRALDLRFNSVPGKDEFIIKDRFKNSCGHWSLFKFSMKFDLITFNLIP